jgi:AraC-like DNA-binding protein
MGRGSVRPALGAPATIGGVIDRTTFSTRDPEVARNFFSSAYVEAAWRGSVDQQAFELSSDRLDAGAFQVDFMRMSSRVVSRFRPTDVCFVTHLRGGSFDVHGAGLEERVVAGELVLGGRPGVETTTDATDIRQDVVTVDLRSLREAAGLDPEGEEVPTFSSIRPAGHASIGTWRATRAYLASTLGAPGAAASPLLVGSARRLLAGLVLETFPNSTAVATAPPRDDGARGSAILRRAVGFIDSNPQRDIGVADIAAAARASVRTVEYAFRRHLETTPTAYLRGVRLDHAHVELLTAAPGDGLTVTEVAYRWGFSSPSRFAAYYRETFGTGPADTLRK